ncbi:uncharacterized protein DEA37_0002792 [Paragonimus westermani]|uniref:C2H2-type domain-containing protein n=1 Tax=Paragonimus westermani TaxID=34504 RepID=A0A5J4NZN9_9TREM|nr:uncharacterized protein DEA37_0002792 [Paragonimus westermani]
MGQTVEAAANPLKIPRVPAKSPVNVDNSSMVPNGDKSQKSDEMIAADEDTAWDLSMPRHVKTETPQEMSADEPLKLVRHATNNELKVPPFELFNRIQLTTYVSVKDQNLGMNLPAQLSNTPINLSVSRSVNKFPLANTETPSSFALPLDEYGSHNLSEVRYLSTQNIATPDRLTDFKQKATAISPIAGVRIPFVHKKNSYKDAPKLITCPIPGCNQKFPWNSSLKRHILTHTPHKPFACTRCTKSFSTKSNRERHMERVHQVSLKRQRQRIQCQMTGAFGTGLLNGEQRSDGTAPRPGGNPSEPGLSDSTRSDGLEELREDEILSMCSNEKQAEDISNTLLIRAGDPVVEPNPERLYSAALLAAAAAAVAVAVSNSSTTIETSTIPGQMVFTSTDSLLNRTSHRGHWNRVNRKGRRQHSSQLATKPLVENVIPLPDKNVSLMYHEMKSEPIDQFEPPMDLTLRNSSTPTQSTARCPICYAEVVSRSFRRHERLRDTKLKRSNRDKWYKQDIQASQTEWLDSYDSEGEIDRENLFAHEIDEDLQRKEFEEFIILQSTNTVQMSHSYFKIVKLFHYINILNPQGTLIALLSLNRYVKCNSEVVQAVEECDGIVMLLNIMECKIAAVQLAAMKLLSNLFQVIYFRRMAIAYGAVEVLVDLLLGSNDHIKSMASDLLSSLALLKEARSKVSKTKGIQHLVCLLDLNAPKLVSDDEHKKFKSLEQPAVRKESHIEENAAREESLLASVATALWRFSRSAVNRTLMQRSGLMLTLTRLIRTRNEKILLPVLGIIQGCAADAAFRLSIRIEGVLKYLVDHLQTTDSHVQMQCCRTIYYCVDDMRMQDAIRLLGGLQTLTSILKKQTAGAYKLIQAGWMDTEGDPRASTTGNSSNRDENNSAMIQEVIVKSPQLSAEPVHEVRVARLRMTGPRSERGTKNTKARSSDCEEGMLLLQILHTVLATIQKCSGVEQNLVVLNNLGAADCFIKLVELLTPYLLTFRQPSCAMSPRLQKFALLERVSGLNISCLARMCTTIKVQKMLVFNATVLNNLMQLLGHMSKDILVPTINSIAAMVTDSNLVQMFNQRSGFRILYSLSFHSDIQVRQAALLAVRAFLQSVPDRAVLLRPINSSLGFMVHSLSSVYHSLADEARKPLCKSETLLSAICVVLAEIASDEQGRTILTELGVVPYLVNITTIAKEDCLRIGVSAAITQFATTVPMIRAFREKEFLTSLIEYIRVGNLELRLNAVKALDKLSTDPVICAVIRSIDITSVFLRIMCDAPQELQAAAAGVIGRVARLCPNSLKNSHIST